MAKKNAKPEEPANNNDEQKENSLPPEEPVIRPVELDSEGNEMIAITSYDQCIELSKQQLLSHLSIMELINTLIQRLKGFPSKNHLAAKRQIEHARQLLVNESNK